MTIKLLPAAELNTDNNHHGLTLEQWYALAAGEAVEVEELADDLLPIVEVIEEAQSGN